MKSFLRIFAIMLLLTGTDRRNAFGQTATDEVWVSIHFQLNGPDQPSTEYYGVIHREDLAAMTAGKMTGLVRMTKVAFMENGQIYALSDTLANGTKFGFKNVMYIRADTIVRIIELDDTFVTQRLLPLKE